MLPEEMKELERAYYEECNKGRDAAIDMLNGMFASDVVWHSASGQDVKGLDNLRQSFTRAYKAFPDTHYTVEDIIVEGDKSVTRFTFSGTYQGESEGTKSSNMQVKTWGIRISLIINGKFAEVWERYDTLGWMRNLGMMPQPERKQQTET